VEMSTATDSPHRKQDVCLACSRPVADRRQAVRVTGGTYAHRACVTYRPRARR
jgi:hypothetical protein